MTYHEVKAKPNINDNSLKIWTLNLSDEFKLTIHANNLFEVERFLPDAKIYRFSDEKGATVAYIKTTGEPARKWLDWQIQPGPTGKVKESDGEEKKDD